MLKTPVIFLIFKRPRETALVWEQIRKAKPSRLFIVADGARNEQEREVVEETRRVVEKVDWDCQVERDYAPKNMGCRRRVWSGIDWAMGQLEKDTDGAIILEDDCLPDQTFFTFCEEMLEKYKNNSQIMHIGGVNFQQLSPTLSPELSTGINLTNPLNTYYFSRIAQIWGWATWKRAWKLYDGNLASWPSLRDSQTMRSVFPTRLTYHYWRHMFDHMYQDKMDTWDVAWTYTVFKEHGLCIMPHVNLIENIGAGVGATHKTSSFVHHKTSPLLFPLVHPKTVTVNGQADKITYRRIFGITNSFRRNLLAYLKDASPGLFTLLKARYETYRNTKDA